ncbi:MAG: alpha/beta hydrolase [Vicinamibacteria bacterium]|nr:alpha/beta hydrolase [Vicinamibacteria bacterium]
MTRGPALLKSVVRIALVALIGATLLLVFLEKQLIYYPEPGLDVTPEALGLPFEEVLLDAEPGVKVHAWFIRAAKQPAAATILFSHGNAGNIADRLDRVLRWRGLDADFLLYDYRGYGRSTGHPDEEGTYLDGRAAYDYLVKSRGVDPKHLILMGESLGCAIAIQLAIERPAGGLVIEAPFASIAHMANAIYPFLPLGLFIRTRYLNIEKVPRLRMPVLVVQGTEDEVIPVEQGKMVFDATPPPRRYLAIDGAHHNDVYVIGAERYRAALSDFIASSLPPNAAPALVEISKP